MKHRLPRLPIALPRLGPSGGDAPAGARGHGGGLNRFWYGLIGRRYTIAAIALIALTLALLITTFATPTYRASVLLQIEPGPDRGQTSEASAADGEDDRQGLYPMQVELLRSRALARRVIDQLGLRLAEPRPMSLTGLTMRLNGLLTTQTARAGPEDLESVFLANLRVTPLKDANVIRVQFDSPKPEEAAAVANAVAAELIRASRERGERRAADASNELAAQGRQIRDELDAAERRLAAEAARLGIVDLDGQIDILMKRIQDLSRELTAAETARIATQAQHRQMVRDGPGRTAAVLDNPVIQTLKEQQAELSARYQEQLKVFKPGYPKMVQMKAQMAELERQIERETTRIGHAARSDYATKANQEARLSRRIDEVKAELQALNERGTSYTASQREAEAHREVYAALLERMREVTASAGGEAGGITIVDAAQTPRLPQAPNLGQNLALALAIGLISGGLLAALLEALDDTVRSSEEAERQVDAPVFGVIPWMHPERAPAHGANLARLPLLVPGGILAESYRSLTTALVLARSDGATLLVLASAATRAGALAGSLRRLRGAGARIPGAVLVKHRRWVGGTVLLVAAALILMLGNEPETLVIANPTTTQGPAGHGHRQLDTQGATVPTDAPDPIPAAPGTAASPPSTPAEPAPVVTSAPPQVAQESPVETAAPVTRPIGLARTPQALIEHLQRYLAAGDLEALLLLLTDDARIANLTAPRAKDAGADFFEAAVKQTLRVAALRLEPQGGRRFLAHGVLHRISKHKAVTGPAAAPAGEIRLELTGEESGYRISALRYRLDRRTAAFSR